MQSLNGDFVAFVRDPLTIVILIVALLALVVPPILKWRAARNQPPHAPHTDSIMYDKE